MNSFHFDSVLLDTITAGVVVLDALGMIQGANVAAGKILGRHVASLVGVEATTLLTVEARARVIAELASRATPFDATCSLGPELELCAVDAEGAYVPIAVTLNFIGTGQVNDASTHIVCTITDLSEQKRLEAALRASDRAKDGFLATLSHELRSPLTVILGHIDLLRHAELSGNVRNSIIAIERSARAQASLVADILEMSRIITGKFRLDLRRFEFMTAVREAAETFKFVVAARGINFQINVAPDVGYIVGDYHRLVQVLGNLLNNAFKFTPARGDVTLNAHRRADAIMISVRDSGCGIDAKSLPYVFRRFWQDEDHPTIRHGGLGVGLAIVRHIVESHGGEVMVSSDGRGLGACFSIRLPQEPEDWSPARGEVELPKLGRAEGEVRPELVDVSVLVVDDQIDARQLIATILTRAGARVEVAGSALEGLDIGERLEPKVIICDIGMPDIDGYEFLELWRQRESKGRARARAIALTAYVRKEDIERALTVGFELHVAKPVDVETLTAAVIRLVSEGAPS